MFMPFAQLPSFRGSGRIGGKEEQEGEGEESEECTASGETGGRGPEVLWRGTGNGAGPTPEPGSASCPWVAGEPVSFVAEYSLAF